MQSDERQDSGVEAAVARGPMITHEQNPKRMLVMFRLLSMIKAQGVLSRQPRCGLTSGFHYPLVPFHCFGAAQSSALLHANL